MAGSQSEPATRHAYVDVPYQPSVDLQLEYLVAAATRLFCRVATSGLALKALIAV